MDHNPVIHRSIEEDLVGRGKQVVGVEETLHFTANQLHMRPDEVTRLARTLNGYNGITARALSQGRDLEVKITARTTADLKRLEYEKVVPAIRHAVDKTKLQAVKEDNAILAFLKS